MATIIILGAGVMGSALAIPPASISGNRVFLVGSPLDDAIVDSVQATRVHSTLNVRIPDEVQVLHLDEVSAGLLQSADVIVLGVSSPGIPWVTKYLKEHEATPGVLALVTKGLVAADNDDAPPLTYADSLVAEMTEPVGRIVGIGGPCIARELAQGMPTRVTFAAEDVSVAESTRQWFQNDYYRITCHSDIVALEACAALKNFLCIGVSAMFSAYPLEDGHAKNPLAALYNQAVHELYVLSQWIASASPKMRQKVNRPTDYVAFDLAGMGDLHVTVGGGRNSRLGRYLGNGETLQQVLNTSMAGVTVEGVDTGRNLLSGFQSACLQGRLSSASLPLTQAILDCIEHDQPFAFDFTTLP